MLPYHAGQTPMTKHSLFPPASPASRALLRTAAFFVIASSAAALGITACATDNGDSVHGPQFGSPIDRIDAGSGEGAAPVEGGGPGPGTDGGADTGTDSSTAPTCSSGTVVVLAGSDTTLSGASQIKGGAWSGAAIAGGAAKSIPSVAATSTGFVALTRGPSDALQSLSYATSWSGVSTLGSLTTLGSPALAITGTKAHGVYLDGTNKFFRVESAGTAFTTTGDAVMPAGGDQSYGPSAGTLAAAGTDIVFAQAGDDEGLYVQKRDTAWSTADAIGGAGTLKTMPPALLAIDGKYDLVLLYADKTAPHVLGFATRDATTKAWSTATVTQSTAQTGEQLAVARISQSVVLVTFRGNNMRPYFMTGTLGASSITWSVPAPLLPDTSTVDTAPAIAKGVCGDDAIAVYGAAGQVRATRYRGGVWTVPEPVTGASGGRISVATR